MTPFSSNDIIQNTLIIFANNEKVFFLMQGKYMRRPTKKGKFLGRFSLKIRVGNGMCRMRSVTLFPITTLIFVILFRT